MKTKEFYDEVARRADTTGTKINAAVVSRVLKTATEVLAEQGFGGAVATLASLTKTTAARK